ncbi:Si-specific NAD(P)(+) transhydrogenase [Candidatus Nitronereus thalassa]|uniref:Soluble pyridine nucleotide transhydrogenase n=1 Tax=Candidatus Nitronereus thalassa TaxID=3020898 RepID=A0ABU3K853_9BACT|nr:Si-specific NAD(P)(+) transhydrogenase [Candidatus Nitronereus thalassa]MDT7042542.1 Si-specific NAD(P)(+) transhydrogenase [Candidatus Nitronereus thalassa]
MEKSSNTSFDYDLICIGSGPAGQRAAVQAAKLGKKAAVIEKRRMVGGACLDTGTIPSKTFREAVLAFSHLKNNFHEHGRGASGRPTASQLLSGVQEVIRTEGDVLEDQLFRNDVAMIKGDASFQDPHTLQLVTEGDTTRIRAENILVAVGTIPTPPPGVPADGKIVINSDGVLSLTDLPRTMAVVGAGVIGLEYASMFGDLGIEVTVVDGRQRPLEFLDSEIVDELIHQMRNKNVLFRLNETVESLEISSGPRTRAVLNLESGKRLVSDLVLYSVGRLGATEALNLKAAGLEADSRGRLTVNDHFQTTVPHIYAAGDVIGYPSLAATSSEQGRLAACYAFNIPTEPMVDHFPIGIYSIPEISMVGKTEQDLTREKIPYESGIARYKEIARGGIMGDDSGFLKMLFHRQDRRLLGVHAIGTGATELIHVGQAVLGMGGGLDYFIKTVFNYPTLAECYKVAALDAYNKLHE